MQIYCVKDKIDVDPTGRLPIYTEWGGGNHIMFYHYDDSYLYAKFTTDRKKTTLAETL
jgi:hypothetical protein